MRISKRFLDRAKQHLRRYQRILADAQARDVNESDTVVIVSDMLADLFGYDKYSELTTEFCIRSTFCDLAVKLNGELRFLIEVKSIGTDLKDNHLRQAIDYGAKQGTEWIVLTNGAEWQAHRIRFEQPIQSDEVFRINLLDPDTKTGDLVDRLSLLSREAASTTEIGKYWVQKEATSRFVLAQLLLDEDVLRMLRRELRAISSDVKISVDELRDLVRNEVVKRELLEGDKAAQAQAVVRRAARRQARIKAVTGEQPVQAPTPAS